MNDSRLSLPKSTDRRRFLMAASATAMLGGLLLSDATTGVADAARPTNGVRLIPNAETDLFRVRIDLDVEGNVDLAANPLVSRKSASKLPISSKAKFDYEERYRRPENRKRSVSDSAISDPVTFAERYYHEASADLNVSKLKQTRELRDLVKTTTVRRETLPEVLYANEDYFSRDELDLLHLPVSSIGVDHLLPTGEVSQGTKYRPTPESLASAFNMTSVDASEIEAEVVSITRDEAKIQFRGNADGSVDGVPTIIRTVGKLTFDRRIGVCTWLAMAVHETRDIGIAKPGFDVAATIKMLRKPMASPIGLEKKLPSVDVTGPIPADRLYVDLHSDRIGFDTLMNRDWRMMSDVPGAAMMRMVRHDRSVAQCDFRSLPSLAPGKQWTLEAFTQDVKQTLGNQLTDLIDSDERVSPLGLRVLRVTAAGSVQGVPIQWVLMHFSDDSGRRMQATFTLEADNVDAFAGSDLQLASSLRLTGRKSESVKDGSQQTDAEMAQSAENTPASTRIADAISKRAKKTEVQSASDLK
ncbi:hypothetical protein [Rubripirellula obstinata]|uniref:hypothetical protein n=1 Tax=Rubripirellula obstinata TaxID=406547 RepID=UPI00122CA17B|nr:hypothetical protein [Rubripirellula obstinata]